MSVKDSSQRPSMQVCMEPDTGVVRAGEVTGSRGKGGDMGDISNSVNSKNKIKQNKLIFLKIIF